MAKGKHDYTPEVGGFVYHDPSHSYFTDFVEMTGVTSVLDCVGSPGGLMQYAANHAAAHGLQYLPPEGFTLALKAHPKLTTEVARLLDKQFPVFKEARLAHKRNTQKAADSGTDNHSLCELWEQGKTVTETEELKRYKEWYGLNVSKTLFVERPIFSKTWHVGGTPDGGFLLKDGKALINDKKFKDSIYDNKPFWQMAAYRKMLEEMASDTTTPVTIIWADNTETYKNPKEYLSSLGETKWNGSVVIQINSKEANPLFRYAYEEDLKSFESSLWIYRHIKN